MLLIVLLGTWTFIPARYTDRLLGRDSNIVDLQTKNPAGRSGVYYVPPSASRTALPLLVLLHGSGGNGRGILEAFRPLADERGFAILAPDSGMSPTAGVTWEVGDHPGEVTEDRKHVMAALAELLARERVTLDPAHVLVAGHSGGGSSAPYLATNEEPFTAFAVLHGGVFVDGLGDRRVRGWFSTGNSDGLRPPARVREACERAQAKDPSYEMHVFDGGHDPGEQEKRALIDWWLSG